uniref:LigA n=1 Tax=Parastrongyloides trichosuri TaxID=131310 RepID=A0A0N4ZL08_PARTI
MGTATAAPGCGRPSWSLRRNRRSSREAMAIPASPAPCPSAIRSTATAAIRGRAMAMAATAANTAAPGLRPLRPAAATGALPRRADLRQPAAGLCLAAARLCGIAAGLCAAGPGLRRTGPRPRRPAAGPCRRRRRARRPGPGRSGPARRLCRAAARRDRPAGRELRSGLLRRAAGPAVCAVGQGVAVARRVLRAGRSNERGRSGGQPVRGAVRPAGPHRQCADLRGGHGGRLPASAHQRLGHDLPVRRRLPRLLLLHGPGPAAVLRHLAGRLPHRRRHPAAAARPGHGARGLPRHLRRRRRRDRRQGRARLRQAPLQAADRALRHSADDRARRHLGHHHQRRRGGQAGPGRHRLLPGRHDRRLRGHLPVLLGHGADQPHPRRRGDGHCGAGAGPDPVRPGDPVHPDGSGRGPARHVQRGRHRPLSGGRPVVARAGPAAWRGRRPSSAPGRRAAARPAPPAHCWLRPASRAAG